MCVYVIVKIEEIFVLKFCPKNLKIVWQICRWTAPPAHKFKSCRVKNLNIFYVRRVVLGFWTMSAVQRKEGERERENPW